MYMDSSKINKVSILSFIAVCFFSLPLSAQEADVPDSAACRIELICEIGDLDVWIDGKHVGQTPIHTVRLEEGTHTLRVRHPDPAEWLNRDWERKIFLKPGTKKRFTVKFSRAYWIGSDPSEASVYYGLRYLGETPLTVEIPPDSMSYVIIRKPGFEDYRFGLDAGRSALIQVSLRSKFAHLNGSKDSPRLNKKWIITSSVAALICGGLGYYFQTKADRAYDRYLNASHPEEMNRHFNDAETFDRYTGVCYGLGEVSLGISIFFLIHGVRSN